MMKSVGLDLVLEIVGLDNTIGANSQPVGDNKDKLIMVISY